MQQNLKLKCLLHLQSILCVGFFFIYFLGPSLQYNGICRRKETGRSLNTNSPTAGPAAFLLQPHDCRMFFQLLVMSRRRKAKPEESTNKFIQCWVCKIRITSISRVTTDAIEAGEESATRNTNFLLSVNSRMGRIAF